MVTRSRSLSNKFIKDKIHRASHIRPFPISTFSKTPLEKDEWDTFQEFYFRYPRLNSNKRVAMSRNPPHVAPSFLHNIHPKRSRYRCHWPPRSSPIAVVYDFRKDSGLETRSVQRRTNLFYKTLVPSRVPTEFRDIWLKSWREDEAIPTFPFLCSICPPGFRLSLSRQRIRYSISNLWCGVLCAIHVFMFETKL